MTSLPGEKTAVLLFRILPLKRICVLHVIKWLITYSMNELEAGALHFDGCGCHITQLAVVCRGYGGFGALGHYVYHRELLPKQVSGPWEGKITHIATSGAHTAAVTDSG